MQATELRSLFIKLKDKTQDSLQIAGFV